MKNKTLFWDVDTASLDPNKHREYIIARVLEEGTLENVREILASYDKDVIITVVKNSRNISPKTGYFWKNYYKINSNIKCIEKHSQNLPKMPWQR